MANQSDSVIPGGDLPEKKDFPGRDSCALLGFVQGIVAGGLAGGGIAAILRAVETSGDNRMAAIFGLATTGMVWKSVQSAAISRGTIKYYQNVHREEPTNVDAYVQEGLLFLEKNDATSARNCFQKALKQKPDFRDAVILLAVSLSSSEKFQEVVDLLEPWLKKNDDVMGEIVAAEASKKLGNNQCAVKHFEKYLELFPKTPKRPEIEQTITELKKTGQSNLD